MDMDAFRTEMRGEFAQLRGEFGELRGELRELTAPADVKHDLITKREVQALQLVADGYSTHEVASRLLVNDRTVCSDLSSAYGKLDARHRTEAIFNSVHWGIISRQVSSTAEDH
jgi:DNA-binding NarL/FixJ family response regulator